MFESCWAHSGSSRFYAGPRGYGASVRAHSNASRCQDSHADGSGWHEQAPKPHARASRSRLLAGVDADLPCLARTDIVDPEREPDLIEGNAATERRANGSRRTIYIGKDSVGSARYMGSTDPALRARR